MIIERDYITRDIARFFGRIIFWCRTILEDIRLNPMKDLIEIILKGIAGYVPVLVSVVTTPKRSILKLITNEPEKLNKALIFGGLTIAIGFAFQAPLLPTDKDFVTVAGSMLALKIVAILTFAGLTLWIFRIVGGKGDYETTLCACLYIISPVYLFLIVTHVISIGLISTHDPEFAIIWRSGQSLKAEQIQEFVSLAPLTAIGLFLLWLFRLLISIIWFLICWGTYRTIHQVSLARSILAYLITTVMWYVYWVLTVLIMKGLHSGALSPIA
jgi:hypothetical protein